MPTQHTTFIVCLSVNTIEILFIPKMTSCEWIFFLMFHPAFLSYRFTVGYSKPTKVSPDSFEGLELNYKVPVSRPPPLDFCKYDDETYENQSETMF